MSPSTLPVMAAGEGGASSSALDAVAVRCWEQLCRRLNLDATTAELALARASQLIEKVKAVSATAAASADGSPTSNANAPRNGLPPRVPSSAPEAAVMAGSIFISSALSEAPDGVKLGHLVRAAEVPIEGLFAVVDKMIDDADESVARSTLAHLREAYATTMHLYTKFSNLWKEAGGSDENRYQLAWYLFCVARRRAALGSDLARSFELLVAIVAFVLREPAPSSAPPNPKRRRLDGTLAQRLARSAGADAAEITGLLGSVEVLVRALETEGVFGRYGANDVKGRAKSSPATLTWLT